MGLKFFNKDTYDSIGDAFKAIKQELLSLCPKDSSSVRWQRGLDGMSATVKAGQSASDDGGTVEEPITQSSTYNGHFTIKDVSTYNEDGTVKEFRVAVCDGKTWNPETETSRSNTLYFGYPYENIYIDSTVFTLPPDTLTGLYIKFGPTNNYINKIITDSMRSEVAVGYQLINIGTVSTEYGALRIEQHYEGMYVINPRVSYNYNRLTVVQLEDEDGKPMNKIAVCDGETWDARKHTGGAFWFIENGWATRHAMIIQDIPQSGEIFLGRVNDEDYRIYTYNEILALKKEDVETWGFTSLGFLAVQFPPRGGDYVIDIYRQVCP